MHPANTTIAAIVEAHRSGKAAPESTIADCFARIRAHGDAAVFISLRDEQDALAEARALRAVGNSDRPLLGVPVAVKDNIDVKGLATTAGCPAFAYHPKRDATCVARLKDAGAIVIGKTNLDQFATGLVGVRSPYGIPRNPFNAAVIPGGSSSGSAVAVAAGLVPLALGTDTAGSGRVPAGLNNIIGFKPSLGLVSTTGVVPACRTVDCVSVFALTVDDAFTALSVLAGTDGADPYCNSRPLGALGAMPAGLRLGVPPPGQRQFFGDIGCAQAYQAALRRCTDCGSTLVEIDMEPFYRAARMLYEGPWVAERYIAARSVIESAPQAMHPVTREIILGGARFSAVDAFAAFYEIADLRRLCERVFDTIDALALPTIPRAYSIEEILADPIELNSKLGTYTSFVNLFDLCALAVPAAMLPDGVPFGITLIGRAGDDALIAAIGRRFHADTALPLGATGRAQPPLAPAEEAAAPAKMQPRGLDRSC
jgi:allophanate hydrolase